MELYISSVKRSKRKRVVKVMSVKNKLCYVIFLISISFSISVFADPVKVGLLLPLTGPTADFGAALRNGVELAKSEKPNEFNKSIEFIYEDVKLEPKLAISSIHKLTKSNKVNLIYVFGSGNAATIAPISEQNKIPTIVLTGEPFVAGGKKYVVDFHNRLSDMGLATLNEMRSKGYRISEKILA